MLARLKSYSSLLLPCFLLLGIALRVVVYLQNRSLMLDEANLARNIVEKSGVEFFQSLDYQQYCPPVFLLLTKWSSLTFGVQEWSLKLLPFLGGILLLLLFWRLLQELVVEPVVQGYLLLVLGFSHLAVRYSTELKQYSWDAFLALVLIYMALQYKNTTWKGKDTLVWMLLGSVLLWSSMPIIFVLAAIGLAFLYQAWTIRKMPWGLIGAGALWLLNFGVYFWLVLYQDATANSLQQYHEQYFFNVLPSTAADWNNNYNLLLSVLTSITDQTALGLVFAALFIGIGSYQLIIKTKFIALLMLLPILFTIVASSLGVYSLIPRLTLFLLPIFLTILGIGLCVVWKKTPVWGKVGLFAVMLISVVNKMTYQYFWTTMEFENSKAIFAYLEDQAGEEDLIYVQQDAVPAFVFYNKLHQDAYQLQKVYLANWEDQPAQIIPTQQWSTNTFWLFFAHTSPERRAADKASANQIALPTLQYLEAEEVATYGFIRKN